MLTPTWNKAVKNSADPARVRHFLDLLGDAGATETLRNVQAEQAGIFAAVLSGSQALGNCLVAHADWLANLDLERLKYPRREQGLRNELHGILKPLLEAGDYTAALRQVNQFKQREMLRIGARDLARLSNASEIILELSDVADVCLSAVLDICRRRLSAQFGQPWHQDAAGNWLRTEFSVLGLGKLGGQELNYSSDVDVLFVYSDEGDVFKEPPVKGKTSRAVLTNHVFFKRLAEAFIAEVSRGTSEGALFRIDLRLRPEGDAGPLCRSLESYENYYAQWGQTWERMMLIKARRVAGDVGVAAEFLEMIQPFRYPREINPDALREIGAMKDRIESEVVRAGELDRNVKLGRGGIREIEFVVQAQQLIHAGKQPFLQCSQTLPGLAKLAQYRLLSEADAQALAAAYSFLRDVEHRLQMEENLQTHTIPISLPARERLAKLMGFKSAKAFEGARQQHSRQVRQQFEGLLKSERASAERDSLPREFAGQETAWKELLAEHSFRDIDKAFRVLREFAEGPGYVHVSPRTTELALHLLPRFFALCPKKSAGSKHAPRSSKLGLLSDPDRVVTRLDSFISEYGARAVLFELWHSNPAIFELLVLLFDRSEFLAELAIRTPDMVDELVTSGRLRQRKSAEETLRDLRHGIGDADQQLWLRRYHQTELMRIGLRDILGLADPEQYLSELSALADACLQYALEVVMRRHRLKSPPFVIIGLGKLGGAEIDYGSDLDLIFVADSSAKNLRKLQQVALDVMELLNQRTELGLVFHTDARLRPDGEKGLLVNTIDAYSEYYRQRALLWEIQSLTRARAVAGDFDLGRQFQQLAAALTDFNSFTRQSAKAVGRVSSRAGWSVGKGGSSGASPHLAPACFAPDWKRAIHQMRLRIEKERTPAGKDALAIKTGKGGLMDAEFVAQSLCLEQGWQEANTVRALERGRTSGALTEAERLIASYRQLRRVEGILRRWSYEGETVLPDDPAPYYRVSVRCGFATPEAFGGALAECRQIIRAAYLKTFDVR